MKATRLPNGHRFVKQLGYKRGKFHNWAIYAKDGNMLSLGGTTKKDARLLFLKENKY